MLSPRPWLLALLFVSAIQARSGSAQGAQAAADLGQRRVASKSLVTALENDRADVIKATAVLRVIATNRSIPPIALIDQAIVKGDEVERTTIAELVLLAERTSTFRSMLLKIMQALSQVPRRGDPEALAAEAATTALNSILDPSMRAAGGIPPVFAFTLSPRTVFSVGLSRTLQKASGVTFDISTNLIGTALAAVTGGLGANNDLKNFVAKNFAVGISLPTKSAQSIETIYSLGLGSADVGSKTLWPVLAMQQLDTMASEIPASLRALYPTENTWAVPYVGFGLTLLNRAAVKPDLRAGKLVPVLSVGVRLPYYYAGGVPAAFGSLFGESGKKFVGQGKPVYVIGISVPLLRNDTNDPEEPPPS